MTCIYISYHSKATCFIVYGYAVTRQCLFSVERTSRCVFFFFFLDRETLFHPQLSLNPVHSTPLKGSRKYRKQFKLFIYETMQTLLKDGWVPGIFHFPFLFFQTFTKTYISLHEFGFGVSFQ